jgi:uncharacterized protein
MSRISFPKLVARAALVLFLGIALFPTATYPQMPAQLSPTGYVNDFAGVLSESAKAQLTALCTEVDQKAHAQIAVVTLKSLDGRPIEDFAVDLFKQWGIGQKQTATGVLILLAVKDHRYRFEVGYGLEPILPDGKTGDFGREAVPYLRQNNYDAALLLMTRRVAEVIAKDRGIALTTGTSVPARQPADSENNENQFPFFLVFLLIGLGYAYLRSRANASGRHTRGGGWWVGPMMGGGGWGGGGGGGGFGGGDSGGGGASGGW